MTRLAILADTRHYRKDDKDDDIYVLSPVAAQLDQLGSLFQHTLACAPLHPGPPPANFQPYLRGRIELRPLIPAGGNSLGAKFRLAGRVVTWIRPLRRTAKAADFVHIRCPCNVGLIALLVVPSSVPWYAMYAGAWDGYKGEPWSYRLQRRLLLRRRNGVVTVYLRPGSPHPDHVVPFFSPTHTDDEICADVAATSTKVAELLGGQRPQPLRVVAVGHLTANKNHATAIRAIALARGAGLNIELDIAGDGELRDDLSALLADLGLAGVVRLHGVLSRSALRGLYRAAHLNVMLSRTEGFPKAVLEGMAAGAVPVLSQFALSNTLTGAGERGVVVDGEDPSATAAAFSELAAEPALLGRMAEAAQSFAAMHTLERFRGQLARLFCERWPATFMSEVD